jgi:hypothetical protein
VCGYFIPHRLRSAQYVVGIEGREAMSTSLGTLRPLPSRVAIADGEGLDGYLERLAAANDLSTAVLRGYLGSAVRSDKPTWAFFMVKPDPRLIEAISRIGGIDRSALGNATLTRFGNGFPLFLDGLDPLRHHTFRRIVAQGWFPPYGSQVCPECLAHDGIWQLAWRLPLVTACTTHKVFLITECLGCGQRFRRRRHSPMRPDLSPTQPCGNPLGAQRHCAHSVFAHRAQSAPLAVLDVAQAVSQAINGEQATVLGEHADPQTYLSGLRHVAALLLHLLLRADSESVDWGEEIRSEALHRATTTRGPRWDISPPKSAVLRGRALAEAHAILCQPTLGDADARLATWLAPIAGMSSGPAILRALLDDVIVSTPAKRLRNRITATATRRTANDRHRNRSTQPKRRTVAAAQSRMTPVESKPTLSSGRTSAPPRR